MQPCAILRCRFPFCESFKLDLSSQLDLTTQTKRLHETGFVLIIVWVESTFTYYRSGTQDMTGCRGTGTTDIFRLVHGLLVLQVTESGQLRRTCCCYSASICHTTREHLHALAAALSSWYCTAVPSGFKMGKINSKLISFLLLNPSDYNMKDASPTAQCIPTFRLPALVSSAQGGRFEVTVIRYNILK